MLFKKRDKAHKMPEVPAEEKNALSDDEVWKLAEKAYIYAFPLMNVYGTCVKMTNTVRASTRQAPYNQLIHAGALADASSRDVVTPNVDTMYSQLCLDLTNDAVILKKPAADRFFSIQVMDAFTNVTAMLGTGGDTDDAETYIFTGPFYGGDIPEGMKEIKMPTNIGWVLIRIFCAGQDDMEAIAELQNGMDAYTLTALRSGTAAVKPEGRHDPKNDFIPVRWVLGLSAEDYFNIANRLLMGNPPAAADAPIMEELKQIGFWPGMTFDNLILGADGERRWAAMVRRLWEPLINECSDSFKLQNGVWQCFGEPIAHYGVEYGYRALVALEGLGANPIDVAMYPKTVVDSEGERLNGANRYLLHFNGGELPPVKEKGFWSITAYNSDNSLLILNPIDRYCINDRSACLYGEDGSLDICVSVEKPDSVPESNWLPVCRGDFHLFMRIYLPENEALDGTWPAPVLKKM